MLYILISRGTLQRDEEEKQTKHKKRENPFSYLTVLFGYVSFL